MNISLKKQNTHEGFTLLEMLFAIIIFSFSLVSLMLIAGKGVVATATAKDQLIAQYLAEEGVEVARNMRDTNFLMWGAGGEENWLTDLECAKDKACDIAYSQDSAPYLKPLEGSEQLLCISKEYGSYGGCEDGGGGEPSKFSRGIYIENIPGDNTSRTIVSKVTWNQRSINREYTLKTYITDWQCTDTCE